MVKFFSKLRKFDSNIMSVCLCIYLCVCVSCRSVKPLDSAVVDDDVTSAYTAASLLDQVDSLSTDAAAGDLTSSCLSNHIRCATFQ